MTDPLGQSVKQFLVSALTPNLHGTQTVLFSLTTSPSLESQADTHYLKSEDIFNLQSVIFERQIGFFEASTDSIYSGLHLLEQLFPSG